MNDYFTFGKKKSIDNKVTMVKFNNGRYGVKSIIKDMEQFWDTNYTPHSIEMMYEIRNLCMLDEKRARVIFDNLRKEVKYEEIKGCI